METAQGVKNIFFEHRKKTMRNAYLAVYGIVQTLKNEESYPLTHLLTFDIKVFRC